MTELRRYNGVPKIVGSETNFVYEAADDGRVVFADQALTAIAVIEGERDYFRNRYRAALEREDQLLDRALELCGERDALRAARMQAPIANAKK